MDINLALMCGIDIPIPECKLILHQPTIKEIAYIGEQDFLIGVQCLCINKTMFSQDKTVLEQISNFQIFMTIMTENQAKDKRHNVIQVLNLLFPNYKCTTTSRGLLFTGNGEVISIDDNNFEIIQNIIRQVFCMKDGRMDQTNFNPVNQKAKEIAEKIMRGREKIAAQKGGANNIFSQYTSVLTIAVPSMSLNDVINLTIYQLYDLIERYELFVNWDMDVRVRLAGGKPDNQPDNWMKNIH